MEEKEVKNEVPTPETAKGKEPEKQVKEKKGTDPAADTATKKRCWFTRLWDWFS